MGIAITLAQYLGARGVKYDVVEHPHTATALETAKAGHVMLSRLAKAVVLKGGDGFMLGLAGVEPHPVHSTAQANWGGGRYGQRRADRINLP